METIVTGPPAEAGASGATASFPQSIHPTDLTVISPCASGTDVQADIIFVHGLMGHPVKTWLYGALDGSAEGSHPRSRLSRLFKPKKKAETSPSNLYWPLFLSRVGNFRIMTYGYDSHPIHFFSPTNQMSITNHAEQLMIKVNWKRVDCAGRPIIFVSHSLGGILVKAAINESSRSTGSASDLAKSCRAIFFFGTPHMGSSAAQFGVFLKNILSVLPLGPDIEDKILRGLSPGSQDLYNITRDFNSIIDKDTARRLKICCIQEGSAISGVKGFARKIVPDDSSCLNRREVEKKFFVQNANHMAMCRFRSPDEPGYRDFCSQLLEYVQELEVEKAAEEDRKRAMAREKSMEEGAIAKEAQQQLLQALNFKERLARQYQLDALLPDPISFDWVWETELGSWLSTTESFFWVKGKPGSGKSTLINHIAQSDELIELLAANAASSAGVSLDWLVVYHFFDFRGQKGIANNFQGFLRSLLFSLVRSNRKFASAVAQILDIQLVLDGFKNEETLQSWVVSDVVLSQALRRGVEIMLGQPGQALILFIDGLDEYEGNKIDMSQFIQSLCSGGRNNKIKVCFSSRAEPPFLTLFRNYPFLSVDRQNMKGIRLWSEVKLSQVFGTDDPHDVEFIDTMATKIADNSEGVFLWTRFALDEVIDGKTKGLSAQEIVHNLEQLPKDMVELYKRIIDKKSPKERRETGILMALVTGSDVIDWDLHLSHFLEAMAISQPHQGSLELMDRPVDQQALVNFRLRVAYISGGMVETQQWTATHPQVHFNTKESLRVVCRVMHRTVETYLNSAAATEQLFQGNLANKEECWLMVCTRYLQGQQMRWTELDDSWVYRSKHRVTLGAVSLERPSLDPTLPFPYSLAQPVPYSLALPETESPSLADDNSTLRSLPSSSSLASKVPSTNSPTRIIQASLRNHVFMHLLDYAQMYERDTEKSSWRLINQVLTEDFFQHHCFMSHDPEIFRCHHCTWPTRTGNTSHLSVEPGARLVVAHGLLLCLEDYLRGMEHDKVRDLFEYAVDCSSRLHSDHWGPSVLKVIIQWCQQEGIELRRPSDEVTMQALRYSRLEDMELVLSLHGPGKVVLQVPICQLVLPPDPVYCVTTCASSGQQCSHARIKCRPLLGLCFGNTAPGYYDASGEGFLYSYKEPDWLSPRLKLLIQRGEDINEDCAPYATALQTAVSMIYGGGTEPHDQDTPLFDSLVSFGANVDLPGPYGNILEQFWMQIHIPEEAVSDDRTILGGYDKAELDRMLRRGRRFICRLIDEFHLTNNRADPNGTIPSVNRMKLLGRNYKSRTDELYLEDGSLVGLFSYRQERKYYQDCNAETHGTRIES